MSLGDPFDVTAQLARKRTEGLQQGINTLSSGLMQAGQGMQTQQMLKQFGILTEKEQPYTIEELKKIAEEKTGSVINVKSSLPPEQQAQVATKLLEASGIKLPKRVTTDVDLDRFAEIGSKTGMEYKSNIFGGEPLSFKPPKKEKTTGEIVAEYQAAQKAIEVAGLPAGTQATSGKGGVSIKAPSATTEKAEINKERAAKILEGIKTNSKSFVPDLVTGFGNPDLRAEIQTQAIEKGINLQDPILEWKGAVRLATSLNGPQQVRLQQVISYADKSIPQMRELSDVFKRFDFTPANEIELKAAMTSTAVSPELRDAATKFMVQYTTMRTDLAQVFSGGYAPTEDAFKLADQSLSKLWGAGQMNAGLDQLQIDLGFKRAALQEVQQTSPIGMYGGQGITNVAGLTQPNQSSQIPAGYKQQRNKRTGEVRLVPIGG